MKVPSILKPLLLVGILSPLVGLQAQAGPKLPQDPVVLLELKNLAELEKALAGSNLSRLLASPEYQELSLQTWNRLAADDPETMDLVQGLWQGYVASQGDLRLGIHLVSVEGSFLPEFVFALETESDPGPVYEELQRQFLWGERQEEIQTVQGEQVHLLGNNEDSFRLTRPFQVGN